MRTVCWQRVFAFHAEVERPLAAAAAWVSSDHFMRSDGSVGSYVTCADAGFSVGEDEGLESLVLAMLWGIGTSTYRGNVHCSHDHSQGSRREDDSPECEPERVLAGGLCVEIPQNTNPEDHQGRSQSDEPRVLTKKRPVAVEVAPENREFRDNEEDCYRQYTADNTCNGNHLLQTPADTTWLTASKKKKLVNMEIFTSKRASAAMMSRRVMIFSTRIPLRMTYPGPARESFRKDIMVDLRSQSTQALDDDDMF